MLLIAIWYMAASQLVFQLFRLLIVACVSSVLGISWLISVGFNLIVWARQSFLRLNWCYENWNIILLPISSKNYQQHSNQNETQSMSTEIVQTQQKRYFKKRNAMWQLENSGKIRWILNKLAITQMQ